MYINIYKKEQIIKIGTFIMNRICILQDIRIRSIFPVLLILAFSKLRR